MDYTKYTVEDFASNESFVDWVNQSDPEAVKFWNFYISEYPEIHSRVEQARTLILNLKRAQDVNYDPALIDSIWDNIENRTGIHHAQAKLPVKRRTPLVIASVIAVGLCIGTWLLWQKGIMYEAPESYAYQNSFPDYVEQVNETGYPLQVQLGDGSVITLENKSRLKYKSNYLKDSTRDVYLLGNAFFNVAKNPYKPFIVHANEVFTKVLGTSFRVEAQENARNIVVSVKTGKVSVYAIKKTGASAADKKEGVILLPNQRVSYERAVQSFDKMLVDSPEIVNKVITKADFTFDNTPVTQVFKTLENAYGVEIIFQEDSMRKCFITAPLGSEPLLDKVKIICQTIGATYEVIDAKIIISGNGC
jgi:hypothetical protein